jgi:hypothetical protein
MTTGVHLEKYLENHVNRRGAMYQCVTETGVTHSVV